MRQRVQTSTTKASNDGKVTKDEGHVAVEEDDFDKLNPVLRVCWQYGGLFLGTIGILGLLWPVLNYDPDVDLSPMHNISWTVVILIAFGIHSTRPYQDNSSVTFDRPARPPAPATKRE